MTDAKNRSGEAGFTLVEVVVCVALLVAACVASLSVLPTLVRSAQSDVLRDAATNLARAAIERVRAATAYYPAGGYTANHGYALNPASSYIATVHVHRGWCDASHATTDVPMSVALAYDAPSDTVTATVDYPRIACDTTVQSQVVVSAQLAPSDLAPGTVVSTAIGDPAQQ
jgi:prepilin-type N-terminal cleavage/methylation domain-containing protein